MAACNQNQTKQELWVAACIKLVRMGCEQSHFGFSGSEHKDWSNGYSLFPQFLSW